MISLLLKCNYLTNNCCAVYMLSSYPRSLCTKFSEIQVFEFSMVLTACVGSGLHIHLTCK